MKHPPRPRPFRRSAGNPLAAILLATALLPGPLAGQSGADDEGDDARYFDFWPGTWVEVVDGEPDPTGTVFRVRQSVHPAAFEERWTLVYGGGAHPSSGLRAWDPVEERWMFTWVSGEGHHQVWEGVKVDGDWYIVRPFEIDGERFLSRQAWLPRGPDELVRIMERSFDQGRTWETRSRTRFRRITSVRDSATRASAADREAVRRFYTRWFGAMEEGDVDGVLALIADDFMLKTPGQPPLTHREALRENLERFHEAYTEEVEWEIASMGFGGEWAWVEVRERVTLVPRSGEVERQIVGTHLAILRRGPEGGWRLFRDVSSFDSPE